MPDPKQTSLEIAIGESRAVTSEENLYDHLPMLFVNASLKLIKFSPAVAKHIDIRETDLGKPISDISAGIKFERIFDDVGKVIAHGKGINREVKAENDKWYQLMTIPYIRQSDNKTDGAIISFNDITELKLIQLELHRTNKNLMNVNADLDSFVHTASHDLLGPLANIEVSIDVMNQLKISDDPQLHKFLEIINSSVKIFRGLLNELATIGKIEDEMSVMEVIDLDLLIDSLTLSIENRIHTTRTIIEKRFSIPQMYFSKKNLRSILYNLISNAIKFKSPDRDPLITISTRSEKGFIILSVRDNGIGIPEKEFQNIFRMYGRLQKRGEAPGIGLYLIKKIIDAAGGNITVESEPGQGSVFTIYFKKGRQRN